MRTRSLTLAGILAACVLFLLYLAAMVPNLKAVLYGLSSLPMAVVVLETDKKTAAVFYAATAVLALLLLPDKLAALPYVLVLGAYGLVKAYAEVMLSRLREWVVKLVYFILTMGIYYLLIVKLLLPAFVWPISPVWLGLAAAALFVVYDFVYTLAIQYYLQTIRPRLR